MLLGAAIEGVNPKQSSGNYSASPLPRGSPPLTRASVLSASRFCRLCLFPYHRKPGSQVPYESPDWSHASCAPDIAWPVSRFPPDCSRNWQVNPAQMPPPVGRPRCQAIARDGRSTPFPSSAMSSGPVFLDRGGRHQSPSPLRRHPQNNSLEFRRARNYHRTAGSVLTVCVSRGDKRTLGLRIRELRKAKGWSWMEPRGF